MGHQKATCGRVCQEFLSLIFHGAQDWVRVVGKPDGWSEGRGLVRTAGSQLGYFTEQPYGFVVGTLTGWPDIASSNAALR